MCKGVRWAWGAHCWLELHRASDRVLDSGRNLSLDPVEWIRVYGPDLSSLSVRLGWLLRWKKLAHLQWAGLQDSGMLLLQMCRIEPMTSLAREPMDHELETRGLVATGPGWRRELEQEQDQQGLVLWIVDHQFDQCDPRLYYKVALEFPPLKNFLQ